MKIRSVWLGHGSWSTGGLVASPPLPSCEAGMPMMEGVVLRLTLRSCEVRMSTTEDGVPALALPEATAGVSCHNGLYRYMLQV